MYRYLFLALLFSGCSPFWGNTIREQESKCYAFDAEKTGVITICSNTDYKLKDIKIILIDSVTKKYKKVIVQEEYPLLKKESPFFIADSITSLMRQEYALIILNTERAKTWYDVSITPTDWKSHQLKYFTENVW